MTVDFKANKAISLGRSASLHRLESRRAAHSGYQAVRATALLPMASANALPIPAMLEAQRLRR